MDASKLEQIVSQLTESLYASEGSGLFVITKSNQDVLGLATATDYEQAESMPGSLAIYSKRGARLLDETTGNPRAMTPSEFKDHVMQDLTRELSKIYPL